MLKMILASTSTVHGSNYLDYLKGEIINHFHNVDTVLFIPFARPNGISHDLYTEKVRTVFSNFKKSVVGLHEFENPKLAIKNAKGIFTGGGNTFVLVSQLYNYDLLETIRSTLLQGIPYLGTSAGSNICGISMGTTNDMPVVHPPSLKTLGIVPFNINAHYFDADPNSKHMGETREIRINEFHHYNTIPVIGLKEGSYLTIVNDDIFLKGKQTAKIFEKGKMPYEVQPNTNLKTLI